SSIAWRPEHGAEAGSRLAKRPPRPRGGLALNRPSTVRRSTCERASLPPPHQTTPWASLGLLDRASVLGQFKVEPSPGGDGGFANLELPCARMRGPDDLARSAVATGGSLTCSRSTTSLSPFFGSSLP